MANERLVNQQLSNASMDVAFRSFQQRQQSSHLGEVPGFSRDELLEIGIEQSSHGGIYYSPDRTNRHMLAQMSLHVIYEIGRLIMNSGAAPAYTQEFASEFMTDTITEQSLLDSSEVGEADEALENSMISCQGIIDSYQGKIPDNDRLEMKNYLLFAYHWTEAFLSNRRAKTDVIKRVQALLPYKVALDHMHPRNIIKLFNANENNVFTMTVDRRHREVLLPNGGSFETDHAISPILSVYIASNPGRFRDFMEEEDIQALQQSYPRQQDAASLMMEVGIGDMKIDNELNNELGTLHFIMGPQFIQKLSLTSEQRPKRDGQPQISGSTVLDEWVEDEFSLTQAQREMKTAEVSGAEEVVV